MNLSSDEEDDMSGQNMLLTETKAEISGTINAIDAAIDARIALSKGFVGRIVLGEDDQKRRRIEIEDKEEIPVRVEEGDE
eukprot:15062007-Ditylum_brightwellii.AAC.1